MHIEILKNLKDYLKFSYDLYKDDPFFKDNKTSLIPLVCAKTSPFYKNSLQKMIRVKKGQKTLCQGILIIHNQMKTEMSIAFFEALPNEQKAVTILINKAEEFGVLHGVKKIIVGLDGHCNYSLGLSMTNNSFPSFGESYNKDYYLHYFKGFKEVKLVSYYDDLWRANKQVKKDLLLFKRFNDSTEYEYANFSPLGLKKTIKRYTDLCNKIFLDQSYYCKRTYKEDYHLFNSMVPLLKKENLIFAKKNGKDIGFVLWYPDFNELVLKGKGAGLLTLLKYRFLGKYPQSVKVVEIGIIEGQRNSVVMLMLFAKALEASARYKGITKILSSWISDDNVSSKNITKRYAAKPYKEFIVFEKDILLSSSDHLQLETY